MQSFHYHHNYVLNKLSQFMVRIKNFGHDRLQGHLLRGSEINKRFGHSRTHYSSPTTHAVS